MIEQYGVLPFYLNEERKLQILLITSRDTGRWVIPRGNPMPGLTPWEAAAQEAFEEAGVKGRLSHKEIGGYPYIKRRKKRADVPALVRIYPLHVIHQSRHWPERHQRKTRWFSQAEAAAAVDEAELGFLILGFRAPFGTPAGAPLVGEAPKRSLLTRLREAWPFRGG